MCSLLVYMHEWDWAVLLPVFFFSSFFFLVGVLLFLNHILVCHHFFFFCQPSWSLLCSQDHTTRPSFLSSRRLHHTTDGQPVSPTRNARNGVLIRFITRWIKVAMGGNDRQWIDSLVTHSSFKCVQCEGDAQNRATVALPDWHPSSQHTQFRTCALSLSLSESLAMTSTCIAYYKSQWESLT